MMVTMIDVPSGWKYGFPKEWTDTSLRGEGFKKWLIENGYPEKEFESLGNTFYYRTFEMEKDERLTGDHK